VTGKYLGEPSNKLVGKMGMESFWPSSMENEIDKAARILRVFTMDGCAADGGANTTAAPYSSDPSAHKKTQKVLSHGEPTSVSSA